MRIKWKYSVKLTVIFSMQVSSFSPSVEELKGGKCLIATWKHIILVTASAEKGLESQNTADRGVGYIRAFQLMDSTSPFSIGLKVPVGPFSTRYQASTSLQGQWNNRIIYWSGQPRFLCSLCQNMNRDPHHMGGRMGWILRNRKKDFSCEKKAKNMKFTVSRGKKYYKINSLTGFFWSLLFYSEVPWIYINIKF